MKDTVMIDLTDLKIKELVGIYNGLNPDTPLGSWKGKKSVLIDRIAVLRDGVTADAEAETTEDVTASETVTETAGNDDGHTRTIRAAAIEHLCYVDYHEDRDEKPDPGLGISNVAADHPRARSVGIPYDAIIRRIVAEFPNCKTSVACLRWYSVKIRVEEEGYEGLRLPQRRPRVRPTAS